MKHFIHIWHQKQLNRKGQKLLVKGKPETALRIFQKAFLLYDSAEIEFNLALSLMALSRFTEAEKHLFRLQKEHPKNELNTLTLAECVMMQQKWQDACLLFENLKKINPNAVKYGEYLKIAADPVEREKYVTAKKLLREATLQLQKKNDDQALKLLLEAEHYFPENSNILNNIGSIYMLTKNYEKAYRYFTKALPYDKQNERLKKNILLARNKLKK